MMKLLKQLLFTSAIVIGFALTASAQNKQEDKKKPPKENAEIKPEENKKPRNNENRNNENRNNENKGKKPQTFLQIGDKRVEITSV